MLTAELRKNLLLAALSDDTLRRWKPLLEPFDMPLGRVLHEPGVAISHVYFPTNAIVSLRYVMEDGSSAETAVVGKEGVVGLALFMGGNSMPSRAVVQSAGGGYRMPADATYREFTSCPVVMHLLLRYTQALLTQMAQTAVCYRHHSLDQQLCRCLLLSLDAVKGDEVILTQELIADMLGVRRGGVTLAALKLQDAGIIKYKRGHIDVLDRPALERAACECYAVVKKEYKRLLLAREAA